MPTTYIIQRKHDFNTKKSKMKNRIKELRAKHNLTQQELANKV